MTDTISSLAQKLRPYWLRDATGGGGVVSGGGGAMSAHALNGPYHTGELDESQAPWAVTDTEFAIHAANPDAHHARAHVLATNTALGPDHSISGAVAGWVLRATASNAARMAQLMVTDLGASGASWDVAALTAANTVGLRTPSSDVRTAPMEALLKSGAAGELALSFLAVGGAMTLNGNGNTANIPDIQFTGNAILAVENSLYLALDSDNSGAGAAFIIGHNSAVTPLSELFRFDDAGEFRITATAPKITTAANYLSLEPATDVRLNPGSSLVKLMTGVMLQSSNYVSQLTGMRVSAAGEGDFRYLYVDEMHAKAFIADLEQALAGGQIITKSVTLLAQDFTVPAAGVAAHIYVADLPSAPGMQVFQAGDIIRLRQFSRAGGGLSITNAWGAVSNPIDQGDGTQRWTFTRSAAPNAGAMTAGAVLKKDLIVLDYGTSGNGFYEVNAIDGLNAANSPYLQFVRWTGHPATGQQLRLRMGQLRGVFGVDEFGLFVGTGVEDTDRYIHLSDVPDQNGIHNLPIRMFNGAVNTGVWYANGQFDIGFDGVSDIDTRDFSIHTSGYVRMGRQTANAANLLYSQAGGYMSLRNGATEKIRLDNNGSSYFAGVMTIGENGEIRQGTGVLGTNFTGLRIWRDTASGRGLIAGYNANAVQWSADTLGRLTAGGGNVALAVNGIRIAPGAFGWSDIASPVDIAWVSGSVRYGSVGGGTMDAFGNAGGVQISGYGLLSAPGVVRLSSFSTAGALVGSASLQGATFSATNLSASGNVIGGQLTTGGLIASDAAIQFWNTPGTALQQIRAGSLMASNTGSHFSRVPASGIYSLGAVGIGVTAVPAAGVMLDVAGQTYMRAAMTLDGALYLDALAAAPAAVAGYLPIYFDNATQTLKARLPGGTIRTISWA